MDLQTALDSEVNRLRAPSPDANPATRAADASARGSGVPAAADAMTRAAEEAAARLEERLEVETRQDRKALRRPSRRMMIEKPEPDRLATVAADRGLDRVRALMGTSWTNRLAALLPEGWILGGCVGDDDGGRAERFEPPSFDRLECTRLCQVERGAANHRRVAATANRRRVAATPQITMASRRRRTSHASSDAATTNESVRFRWTSSTRA